MYLHERGNEWASLWVEVIKLQCCETHESTHKNRSKMGKELLCNGLTAKHKRETNGGGCVTCKLTTAFTDVHKCLLGLFVINIFIQAFLKVKDAPLVGWVLPS